MTADPLLVRAWLEGRSLARGLPQPVAEFGGFRIDTCSEKEVCRWVFPSPVPSLCELARSVRETRRLLKLFGTTSELAQALPPEWTVEGGNWFMAADDNPPEPRPLAAGYRLERSREGKAAMVEIRGEGGELAARGYAAETPNAFVYDRIVTEPNHRRRGLGRAVMAALGSCRRSNVTRQLLVATADGQALYTSLGWRTLSPYATAYLPGGLENV